MSISNSFNSQAPKFIPGNRNLAARLSPIKEARNEDTFILTSQGKQDIEDSWGDFNDRDVSDMDESANPEIPDEIPFEEEKEIEDAKENTSFSSVNDRDISGFQKMLEEYDADEQKIRKQNKNKVPLHVPVTDLSLSFEPHRPLHKKVPINTHIKNTGAKNLQPSNPSDLSIKGQKITLHERK